MIAPDQIEQECLDEARNSMPSAADLESKLATVMHSIELEGTYPDTEIVASGERTYGGQWNVRLRIWDERAGGFVGGQPSARTVGLMLYTAVIEARSH